jgi:hypothetical protein
VNFYGALNLHTGQETVMRTTAMMNGATTSEYLKQVLDAVSEGPSCSCGTGLPGILASPSRRCWRLTPGWH